MTNPHGQSGTAPGRGDGDGAGRAPDGGTATGGATGSDGTAGAGNRGIRGSGSAGPLPAGSSGGAPSEGARTAASPAIISSSGPAPFPGGSAGRQRLADHGWLDADGRLMLRRSAPADQSMRTAFCGFLFGTPEEVKAEALLNGTVILDEVSGYQPAAGDTGSFRCLYDADGTQTLALQVDAGPPVDATLPGHLVIVTDGDLQGVLSYSPDYTGDTMAEHTARSWLRHAIARTSPGNQ